jgi:RHS repeat-associated protein
MKPTPSRLGILVTAALAGACQGDRSTDTRTAPLTSAGSILDTQETTPGSKTTVGRTPGDFSVTDDGQASYRIPIWTPAGVMGIEPSLVLSYNSGQGAGPLGVGWTLTGMPISQIVRCAPSIALDGDNGPVDFDGSTYCMDGKRLVWIGGLEFRTERDEFSKIVAGGSVKYPDGFTVYLKNGRILTYGSTDASRMTGKQIKWTANEWRNDFPAPTVQTTGTYAWGLDSVRDRVGALGSEMRSNVMTVSYLKETRKTARYPAPFTFAEFLPQQIDYSFGRTGNTAHRSVKFTYTATRPDPRYSFVSGFGIAATKRLERIDVSGPNPVTTGLLRSYELTYDAGPVTHRARLKAVTECDGAHVCKKPTQFEWDDGSNQYADLRDEYWFDPTADDSPLQVLDINGDGVDDIAYRRRGLWVYRLGTLKTDTAPLSLTEATLPFEVAGTGGVQQLDVDRDGRTDFAAAALRDYVWEPFVFHVQDWNYFRSTRPAGGGVDFSQLMAPGKSPWIGSPANTPLFVADLDGDGLPETLQPAIATLGRYEQPAGSLEFVAVAHRAWWYRRNQGNGSMGPITQVSGQGMPWYAVEDGWNSYVAGVDGTSRQALLFGGTDLVFPVNTIGPIHHSFRYHAALMTHTGETRVFDTTLLNADSRDRFGTHYLMLDVNGDGLVDALRVENGDGMHPETAEKLEINTGLTTQGVGFADVSGSRMVVREVPSAEFRGNMAYLFNTEADPGIRVADMNQDGLSDVVFMARAEPDNGRGHRDFVNVLQGATDPTDRDTLTGGAVPTLFPSGETLPTAAKLHNNYSFAQLGDFNGDGLMDIALRPERDPNHLHIYIHQGNKADQITHVTDGNGSEIKIGYRPISDANVYTPAPPGPDPDVNGKCRYPIYCLKRGMWVVSWYFVSDDDLKGKFDNFQLRYEDGHTHAMRGWFGFRRRILHDGNTGADLVTQYNNDTFFTAGLPEKTGSIVREDAATLHRTVNVYQYEMRPRSKTTPNIFAVHTSKINFDEDVLKLNVNGPLDGVIFDTSLSHQTVRSTATTFVYDDLGNVKDRTMVTPRGEKYQLVSHFDNDPLYDIIGAPNGPLIGVLRETDEISTARNGEVQQRTTFYEPYPKTHLVKTLTVEPNGDDSVRSVTKYLREPEGLGQPTQTIVTTAATGDEPSIPQGTKVARKTISKYDDVDGVYLARVTNNLSQPTSFAYHGGLGVLAAEEDPNGIVTTFQYDGFGRPRALHPPRAGDVTTRYELPPAPPAALSAIWPALQPAYAIRTTHTGGGEAIVTFNRNGHEVLRQERGFDGQFSYVFKGYSKIRGQVAAMSRPFRDGDTPVFTQFAYDNLGRPIKTTLPDQNTITQTYTPRAELGVVVRRKEPSGVSHDTGYDDFGRVVGNTTGNGEVPGLTTFVYGPFSVLRQVNPPRVANSSQQTRTTLTMSYDVLGRRTELSDADAGKQSRRYNAYGEVIKEIDGNSAVVQYSRDELGRVRSRSAYNENAYFDWDTAPNGIGKLASSSSGDFIYKTYGYDSAGRLERTSWAVGGKTYVLSHGYDSSGRLKEIDYPAVGDRQLRVEFEFDAIGQISEVHSLSPGTTMYWRGISRTAENRPEWETTGTWVFTNRVYDPKRGWLTQISTDDDFTTRQLLTYDHDPDGNITGRHDMLNHVDEGFTYDAFSNRQLETWSFTSPYGEWSVGYYPGQDGSLAAHDALGPNATSTWYDYTNGGGAAAHGVTTIDGQTQFAYDAKGNQTQRWGWDVSYNSFNQPTRMNLPDYSQYWDFAYDGDQQRTIKNSYYYGTTQQTIYIGGLYERRTNAYGTITHVFYIPGADRLVAQETWSEDTLGNVTPDDVMYLHDDILGSIESTSSLSGSYDSSYKYDPFGGRIYPTDPTFPGWSLPNLTLGYTGHQMDDDLGLIHMRGRTYDPKLGRFLTPDPIVAEPFSTLSYDRYAYVFNNPMKYIDPSGFDRKVYNPGTDTVPPAPSIDTLDDQGKVKEIDLLDRPAGPPPPPDGAGYPTERADSEPSGSAWRTEVEPPGRSVGGGLPEAGGPSGAPCPGCVVPFDFGQPELHRDRKHEREERHELFEDIAHRAERVSQGEHLAGFLGETIAPHVEHAAPYRWMYPQMWPLGPIYKDPKWLAAAEGLETFGKLAGWTAIAGSGVSLAATAYDEGPTAHTAVKALDLGFTVGAVYGGVLGVATGLTYEAYKYKMEHIEKFMPDLSREPTVSDALDFAVGQGP